MTDHIVLPVTHTGMLASASVAEHVVQFLNTGRFLEQVPGTSQDVPGTS